MGTQQFRRSQRVYLSFAGYARFEQSSEGELDS